MVIVFPRFGGWNQGAGGHWDQMRLPLVRCVSIPCPCPTPDGEGRL